MLATPSTRFSAVIVPVLSKQQASTLPAKGIWKGSVQKMAHFCIATKLALTAKLSSIDYSGGTILVMIIMQSRKNLLFLRPRSITFTPTCGDSEKERESNGEEGFEVVGTDLLCAEEHCANELAFAVPKPVRRTTARVPPPGVHAGSPGLDCMALIPPNSAAFLCAP